MRGDPPVVELNLTRSQESTPHARGSTPIRRNDCYDLIVYPACAGIHLEVPGNKDQAIGLPRMRGDPPQTEKPLRTAEGSTPHARGSTLYGSDRTHSF